MLQSKRDRITLSILGKLRKRGAPKPMIEDIELIPSESPAEDAAEEGMDVGGAMEEESNDLLPLEPGLRRKPIRKKSIAPGY